MTKFNLKDELLGLGYGEKTVKSQMTVRQKELLGLARTEKITDEQKEELAVLSVDQFKVVLENIAIGKSVYAEKARARYIEIADEKELEERLEALAKAKLSNKTSSKKKAPTKADLIEKVAELETVLAEKEERIKYLETRVDELEN